MTTAVSVDSELLAAIFEWFMMMVSSSDNDCYELNSGCCAVYGFEYKPGFQGGHRVEASSTRTDGTFLDSIFPPFSVAGL